MHKKFDFNNIKDFNNHINKSIPNYNYLIDSIISISEYFFIEKSNIYDLGCSTGRLLKEIDFNCNKIGYDNSNLLPQEDGFLNVDLENKIEIFNASIVYSIFTMQFLSPIRRSSYLKEIYDGLIDGGCLIICEKIYQSSGKLQEIFSFSHYDYKLKQFKANEILGKEKDLRFIMKPCDDNQLYNLLKDTGFSNITVFWQMFNFKGYIAIK